MGALTLTISYAKNTDLVLSSVDLINLYFFGTPPKDAFGNYISQETIDFYIQSAQIEIEHFLNLKLQKTYIQEDKSFFFDDWIQWGFMPTTYTVVKAKKLEGWINTQLQISYLENWLKTKNQNPDKDGYHRSVHIMPSGNSNGVMSTPQYVGIAPHMGYFGSKRIPYYWHLEYITGFDKVPVDILKAIGMLASLNLFIMLQDSALGGVPGVVSKSVGIDGLSQSTSVNSKGIYANRIEQYKNMLDDGKGGGLLTRLKSHYQGILLMVC